MLGLNTLWRVIPFVEIFCKFLVWAFNLAMGFTHWNKALVWCIAGWVAFVWNVGDTLMDYSSKNVMNQLDKRWTVVKIMIAWHHSAFIRLRSRRKSIYNVSLLIKQNWYFKYFKNFFRYFLIVIYIFFRSPFLRYLFLKSEHNYYRSKNTNGFLFWFQSLDVRRNLISNFEWEYFKNI